MDSGHRAAPFRPTAPSLDVMAANTSANANPPAPGTTVEASYQDSRSSSSSSPAPPDNEESDFFVLANDSGSSLSIPNFHAMRVSDGAAAPDDQAVDPAPINRLPNEILISIFAKLKKPAEVLQCMLACRRWARNAVEMLWHRPMCSSWSNFKTICRAMHPGAADRPPPFFAYHDFIRRLNLAALAADLNDGSVMPLGVCNRIERLTLTNCRGLHDSGIMGLVENNASLLALDISGASQITERTIMAIADNCKMLQGLNISGCHRVSNESMIHLAHSCRYIKRLKLNGCHQLRDEAVQAFADNCRNMLEIDLHECVNITNEPITSLLVQGRALRELRLANCELISDSAFLNLPPNRTYDSLRILDLTACSRLTDAGVQRIIDVAPRLRNVVLSKCRALTDAAIFAVARLGRYLHYIHLGHCVQITDEAVKRLIHSCNRIRYIDLGCCVNLTDASVSRLATLPKLKRIGLVKCSGISDESVIALARSHRAKTRRDVHGNVVVEDYYYSSLERVHLSYCTHLTLNSIIRLLNACPRLTHLSLTGVHAFLRNEFQQFGREPPPEFTEHQRSVFCVFSGNCVKRLREYLNTAPEYEALREAARPRLPGLGYVLGEDLQVVDSGDGGWVSVGVGTGQGQGQDGQGEQVWQGGQGGHVWQGQGQGAGAQWGEGNVELPPLQMPLPPPPAPPVPPGLVPGEVPVVVGTPMDTPEPDSET